MLEAAGRGEGETCADGKVTWVVDRAHTARCRLRIATRKRTLGLDGA
jgi:hypothetical protein